jgi:hypothetical protein
MDALISQDPKHDLVTLVPLTARGRTWLESYPPFDGEALTLALDLLPSLEADALSEGVSLTSEALEEAVVL